LRTHYDSDDGVRSWRSIKTVGSDTKAKIIQPGGEPLARNIDGLDRDRRRKNANKERVQGAAVIGAIFAQAVVMMRGWLTVLLIRMARVDVRRSRYLRGSRIGQWRRYNAGKLGDQE